MSEPTPWRIELVEAELRVAALESARDAARAEYATIARIVNSMESLERRRRDREAQPRSMNDIRMAVTHRDDPAPRGDAP